MDQSKYPTFKANRVTRSYRQTINAPPEEVFPLLCPVREAEWLDGWKYEMIYPGIGSGRSPVGASERLFFRSGSDEPA